MSHMKHFEHLKIELEAIKAATNNFSDECSIGKGGFGKVYKGEIVISRVKTVVALKRLDRSFGQGDPQFWKEIMMLSQYKHANIVSLLGYCDDCGEKILVYEYAPKTSLERYLNSSELTWVRRLKICIGVARGLEYLHNAVGITQQRILHRDIKSSNIILDDNWNAKISDFGLSKFGPANQKFTFLFSEAVGTPGYVDPLYAETGFLTKESDVYSFGVVLFEVLCGRLCFDYKDDKNQSLIGLARQSYEQNTIKEIICNNIKDKINRYSLQVYATIAYQCLKRAREERPKMSLVVTTLETALKCQETRASTFAFSSTSASPSLPHRNVKSANILLHESWAPKITNFGLAITGPTNDQPLNYVDTLVKSTYGYLDPDYFLSGTLTMKSDVYGFGVVLLEVLCRKRAIDRSLELQNLAAWFQDCIKKDKLKHIPDPGIKDQIAPKCLKEFGRTAERCLHDVPKQRPTMVEVLFSLESLLTIQDKYNDSLQPAGRTIFGRIVNRSAEL